MDKAAEAARKGDLAYFEGLAPDVLAGLSRKRDEDERSLLHSACSSGSLPLVQLLAAQPGGKTALDAADDEGWAPLHTAVSSGHEAVADYLIGLGADVNAANSGGRTALHYAASKGKVALIKLLIKHGANINAQDSTGSTACHRAASAGSAPAMEVLLEEGKAKIDVKDKEGQTALYVAVSGDQAQCALLLASRGADLHAATKSEDTPLKHAGENGAALQRAAEQRMEE